MPHPKSLEIAARFERARKDHVHEAASDYCELIDELIQETGEARAVDLAKLLGISQVSVGKTVQRLARDGFVTALPYRSIFLTETGTALAAKSRERHELVLGLLQKLGVPEEAAHLDAEGIEHHVSDTTLAAIRKFLESGGR